MSETWAGHVIWKAKGESGSGTLFAFRCPDDSFNAVVLQVRADRESVLIADART